MSRRKAVMAYLKEGYTKAWVKGDDELARSLHGMYCKFEEMDDEEWLERYDSEVWEP